MKNLNLEKLLINTFILLIINIFNFSYAATDTAKQCEQALAQGDYEKAVAIANKTKLNEQAILLCKGRAFTALENNTEAEAAFKEAVEQAKPGFNAIIAHLVLGNFYQENKQLNDALTHFEKSLALSKQDNNKKFTRISHNLIAETYASQQQHQQALDHYLAGEALSMNDNERADSYERLALTYQALKQLDSAIEYQLKGSMMQKKSGTLDQYAESSIQLGRLFTENKEYANAEKTLNKLLKFAQDNGGAYYEAKSQIYLADNKRAQGDSAAEKALLAKAEAIANKIQANDLKALIQAQKK